MNKYWMEALSEEVRDQLGMQDDWRYRAAPIVAQYAREHGIALAQAGVNMDRQGMPVLFGSVETKKVCWRSRDGLCNLKCESLDESCWQVYGNDPKTHCVLCNMPFDLCECNHDELGNTLIMREGEIKLIIAAPGTEATLTKYLLP